MNVSLVHHIYYIYTVKLLEHVSSGVVTLQPPPT